MYEAARNGNGSNDDDSSNDDDDDDDGNDIVYKHNKSLKRASVRLTFSALLRFSTNSFEGFGQKKSGDGFARKRRNIDFEKRRNLSKIKKNVSLKNT